MKVVVTGATGFLGQKLVKLVEKTHNCISLGFNNALGNNKYRVDLINKKETFDLLNILNPDVVIHTAALADVDKCQKDPFYAYQLNVKATKNIVEWANNNNNNLRFIYISTDQVYNNKGPSREDGDVSPINVYGMTKLWGEEKALLLNNIVVLRVNFVGLGGGLVDWLIEMSNKKNKITLFEDVIFNPIYMPDLVNIIARLVDERYFGVFNIGSSGESMTKAEYAKKIIVKLHLEMAEVITGKIKDLKHILAPRSTDMSINVSKIENSLGIQLPSLEEGIESISIDYIQTQKKHEKRN